MSKASQYRYPGIRSFEAAEQYLFFGRKEEIGYLYAQVKTLKLIVMFSKSGIGKSSLINAGLLPLLALDPYIPIKIRFQDTSISPSNAMKNALEGLVDKTILEHYSGGLSDQQGFWETLRSCKFVRYGQPAIPVLILDQFEEFFLHTEPDRKEFLHDLADLVSDRLPNRVRDHLLSIPIDQRTEEDMAWHSPIKVKIVIAIRSDRLSLLDEMSVEIPIILHNRFQLKPLKRRQAIEAITAPTVLQGTEFITPPFTYKKETLDLILDELKNKDQEIESFHLQIVCQDIERKIEVSNVAGLVKNIEVDHYFVKSREDIQSIINNYYEKSIVDLPDEYEERARNFIETGLIVGGRRVGVNEEMAKELFGIDDELLRLLVNSRLVRIENTHLGRSIEISHDALVEPILQSYEIRRERLEAEAAEREIQERERLMAQEMERRTKEQKLAHEQRMRKRSRIYAAITSILALFAIIGWVKASRETEKANVALSDVIESKAQADKAIQKYKEAELRLLSTKIDVYMTANQPAMALKELDRVKKGSIELTPDLVEKEKAARQLVSVLTKNK